MTQKKKTVNPVLDLVLGNVDQLPEKDQIYVLEYLQDKFPDLNKTRRQPLRYHVEAGLAKTKKGAKHWEAMEQIDRQKRVKEDIASAFFHRPRGFVRRLGGVFRVSGTLDKKPDGIFYHSRRVYALREYMNMTGISLRQIDEKIRDSTDAKRYFKYAKEFQLDFEKFYVDNGFSRTRRQFNSERLELLKSRKYQFDPDLPLILRRYEPPAEPVELH